MTCNTEGMDGLKLSLRRLLGSGNAPSGSKMDRQAQANEKFADSLFPKQQAWF